MYFDRETSLELLIVKFQKVYFSSRFILEDVLVFVLLFVAIALWL